MNPDSLRQILKAKYKGSEGNDFVEAIMDAIFEKWDRKSTNAWKLMGYAPIIGAMLYKMAGFLKLAAMVYRKAASRNGKQGRKSMTLDDLRTIPTQADLGTMLVGITLSKDGASNYRDAFNAIIVNNYAKGIRNEMSQEKLTEQKNKIWFLWRNIGNRNEREKEKNDQIDQWIRTDHSAASRAKRSTSPARAK